MPCVVVILSLPDTPPATPTESAVNLDDPSTESAVAFLELSYRLQLFRVTAALPWPLIAALAFWFSDSTQPSPSAVAVTAEATEILRVENPNTRANVVLIAPALEMVKVEPPEIGDWAAVTTTFCTS